jgi:hypothetical protein
MTSPVKSDSVVTLRSMVWLLLLPVAGAALGLIRSPEVPFDSLKIEALPFEVLSVVPAADEEWPEDVATEPNEASPVENLSESAAPVEP